MNSISKVRIEIGNYGGDPEAAIYEMGKAQYKAYSYAEAAYHRARVARDKALGEPVRYPKGICNFWITNVRLTKDGNEYIKAGTEGDLNVIETNINRKIAIALFYPVNSMGFGQVIYPEFKRIGR